MSENSIYGPTMFNTVIKTWWTADTAHFAKLIIFREDLIYMLASGKDFLPWRKFYKIIQLWVSYGQSPWEDERWKVPGASNSSVLIKHSLSERKRIWINHNSGSSIRSEILSLSRWRLRSLYLSTDGHQQLWLSAVWSLWSSAWTRRPRHRFPPKYASIESSGCTGYADPKWG